MNAAYLELLINKNWSNLYSVKVIYNTFYVYISKSTKEGCPWSYIYKTILKTTIW
jgi:hypothetical protein